MQFDNIETIKQAIAIAAGVSILPRPAVAKEVGIRMLGAVPLGDRRAGPAGRHHPPEGQAPAARGGPLHRRSSGRRETARRQASARGGATRPDGPPAPAGMPAILRPERSPGDPEGSGP